MFKLGILELCTFGLEINPDLPMKPYIIALKFKSQTIRFSKNEFFSTLSYKLNTRNRKSILENQKSKINTRKSKIYTQNRKLQKM